MMQPSQSSHGSRLSKVQQLATIALNVTPEEHATSDQKVHGAAALVTLRKHGWDADLASILLSAIVKSSPSLNKMYIDPEEAARLINENDGLLAELESAWAQESFARIRSLKILQTLQSAPDDIDSSSPNVQTTPTNTTFSWPHFSPKRTQHEIDSTIEEFCNFIRPTMREFVNGKRSLPTWNPADAEHPEAAHIRALKIPWLAGPNLLLHGLGVLARDGSTAARLSELFRSDVHTFMCNVSGSGKTRLLLEGLNLHWGFYFVCKVDSGGVGSSDLPYLIADRMEHSVGWQGPLPPATDPNFEKAIKANADIASRLLKRVLLARMLIFRLFLQTAKEDKNELTENHRRLWLLLQVAPTLLLRPHVDVFDSLCWGRLPGAADDHVSKLFRTLFSEIALLLGDKLSDMKLFCVLDEAQVAANSYPHSFLSSTNTTLHRPVLKEIVKVWSNSVPDLRFVVAGTGVSVEVVNGSVGSAIMKREPFKIFHDTGAFDDRHLHEAYIRLYLPREMLQKDTGQALLSRLWHWLHGRYRFTAAYISLVLQSGWRCPHRLLDALVRHYTGYSPSDGSQSLRNNEQDLSSVTLNDVTGLSGVFNFEELAKQAHLVAQASRIVFRYLTRRSTLLETDYEMVEIGFARFLRDSARVDEHLSLLSLARWLDSQKGFTFETYLTNHLAERVRWEAFEDAVAYYLCRAFQPDVPLTDIFEFSGAVPEWANQGAQLVTFTKDEHGLRQWAPVDLFSGNPSAPGAAMVVHFTRREDVVNWLDDQGYIAVCIPDDKFGPDHFLVLRLADRRMLWVAVQAKCFMTTGRLPTRDLISAINSLTPSVFCHRPPRGFSPEPALGALPNPVNMTSQYPLLRVLACWPTTAEITNYADLDAHPLATLKPERFLKSISTGILSALGRQFDEIRQQESTDDGDIQTDEWDNETDAQEPAVLRRSARKRTRYLSKQP